MTQPEVLTTAPVLRMFDVAKTRAFYVDWLGFSWDWEHRFSAGMPLYAGVSLGDLHLHLSEHHGDGTPGSLVSVFVEGLRAWHGVLMHKNYPMNRPGLEPQPWGLTMQVTDPASNRLSFIDASEKDDAPVVEGAA